jgi:hypothetical protein
MRAHMHGIQDREISHQRELTQFLDLEINFVQQYLDVLKEVRDEWPDKYVSVALVRVCLTNRLVQINCPFQTHTS